MDSLGGGASFQWEWIPAIGRSGGILLGLKRDTFDIISFLRGQFFLGVEMVQKNVGFRWELIIVYGPADHSRSLHFLQEMHSRVGQAINPLVIGGDFNLLRYPHDKNSGTNLNHQLMHAFNEWVADLELLELPWVGARYTWTNNQDNPIRYVLDRVFVLTEWERKFPACSLMAKTHLGSDHCPLILQSGECLRPRQKRFFFEKQWTLQPGFVALVSTIWTRAISRPPHRFGPL